MMMELSYIGCFGIGIVGTCMQGGCRPGLMICNQRMISAAVDIYLAMHCTVCHVVCIRSRRRWNPLRSPRCDCVVRVRAFVPFWMYEGFLMKDQHRPRCIRIQKRRASHVLAYV
jgi:hypothetical protein